MSREIKFRAWGKRTKQMFYKDFAVNAEGTIKTWGLFEYLELMQFTGLKDKLGREVYEGDIIRNSNADICQIPAEVFWEEFGGQFRLATGGERQYDKTRPINFVRIGEVIGNIYENPELVRS